MGLYASALIRILKMVQWDNVKNKSLCMMGKQSILVEVSALKSMLDMFAIAYDKKMCNEMLNAGKADSYAFFRMIGFKEVHALDYSSYEGADLIYDLNEDLSKEIAYKYDYIIDGGLTEHVYNVAKTIENMSMMLAPGGIIIHILPLAGLVDHGFYSFSPTFFMDFYGKNGFSILDLDIEFMMHSFKENRGRYGYKSITSVDCRFFEESVDDWEKCDINEYVESIQALKEVRHAYIWCIARKEKDIPLTTPIQGTYQKVYELVNDKKQNRRQIINESGLNNFFQNHDCVALFGAGKCCNDIINILYQNDLENRIDKIYDSNIAKAGEALRRYPIVYPTYKKLVNEKFILIASYVYSEEIYTFLVELGVNPCSIYKAVEL